MSRTYRSFALDYNSRKGITQTTLKAKYYGTFEELQEYGIPVRYKYYRQGRKLPLCNDFRSVSAPCNVWNSLWEFVNYFKFSTKVNLELVEDRSPKPKFYKATLVNHEYNIMIELEFDKTSISKIELVKCPNGLYTRLNNTIKNYERVYS